MRKPIAPLAVGIIAALFMLSSRSPDAASPERDQASRVRDRFFETLGGSERIRELRNVTFDALIDATGDRYTGQLSADGRFRLELDDRTIVYDGKDYWVSFHGVVQKAPATDLAGIGPLDLREYLCHGLLDSSGRPVDLIYQGQETSRGRPCDLIAMTTASGERRTIYVDAETGLVPKLVSFVPDSTLRELKNIFTFEDYTDVGGLRLPARLQGQCLTSGDPVLMLTVLSNLRLNDSLNDELFRRPERTAAPVELIPGGLAGQVVAFSAVGSLITNVTVDDLAIIGAGEGSILRTRVRGHEMMLPLVTDMLTLGNIQPGDYFATLNSTPVVWLVKAFVGMRSDDSTYAVGDTVRLSLAPDQE